jgi:uncharacterized protein (UPF0332 family)
MNTGFYDKARRSLEDAEFLFDAGRYEAAANRAYYASFYAAIAVLARFGIEHPDNPHAWVQAKFSSELIHRRKIFPKSLTSSLPDIQAIRHVADYQLGMVSKNTVFGQMREAKMFTQQLFTYLEKSP